jgi:hypothetical protein
MNAEEQISMEAKEFRIKAVSRCDPASSFLGHFTQPYSLRRRPELRLYLENPTMGCELIELNFVLGAAS